MNPVSERDTARAERLKELLFEDIGPRSPLRGYALLDAARGREVYEVVRHFPERHCLFRGELTANMRRAAPYLIDLNRESESTRDLLELGWGEAWGFFLYAPATVGFEDLRRHLRRLLRVRDEAGRRLFFRYYDPRILRVYLPTCTPEEIHTFYGPITRVAMEAREPRNLIRYDRNGRVLERTFHPVG